MNSPTSIAPETERATEIEIPVELELRAKNGERTPAFMQRLNAGFIQLSSPAYLLKDTRLFVIFDRQRIEVEVVYCKPEDNGRYLVGVRTNPESPGYVRREARLPLDLPAKIAAPQFPAPVNSRVVDMSRNGLGLTVPFEIPVGTIVSVELSYGIAHGEIRHCTQKSPGSWRVGLCLEEFVFRKDETEPWQAIEEPSRTGLRNLIDQTKKFLRLD